MTNPITSYGRGANLDTTRPSAGKPERRGNLTELETKGGDSQAMSDRVDLSGLASKVTSEPAFDRAKVESIRRAIQEGQYAIDPKRIAESFVSIEQMIKG